MLLGAFHLFADTVAPPTAGIAPDPALIEKSAPLDVDTSHRTAARGWIIAGTILEATGLAGMLAGFWATALDDSRSNPGRAVVLAAGSTFTLGGFISTAAHTSRHLAYKRSGIEPRKNMAALSWLFTSGTTALWAVSVGYFASPETETKEGILVRIDDDLDALLVMAFSMVCEVLNLSVFRMLWRRDMRLAEEKRDFEAVAAPFVIPSGTGSSGYTAAGLAVVGSF